MIRALCYAMIAFVESGLSMLTVWGGGVIVGDLSREIVLSVIKT